MANDSSSEMAAMDAAIAARGIERRARLWKEVDRTIPTWRELPAILILLLGFFEMMSNPDSDHLIVTMGLFMWAAIHYESRIGAMKEIVRDIEASTDRTPSS